MTIIQTREEYDFLRRKGIEPLMQGGRLHIAPSLRREIQAELFHGRIPVANERFYRWMWEHKPHRCEECMRPLEHYSAVYVSHILSRGAHPEMAHDPRNVNILCGRCHERWENGNRSAMRIYEKNQMIIEQLRRDYEG